MPDITREARGRPCQIRLPGCDGGGPSGTVVACHFPLSGFTGWAMKPPDIIAAWGCRPCHDRVDGRINYPRAAGQLALAIGVLRTISILWKEGKLRYEP